MHAMAKRLFPHNIIYKGFFPYRANSLKKQNFQRISRLFTSIFEKAQEKTFVFLKINFTFQKTEPQKIDFLKKKVDKKKKRVYARAIFNIAF